LPEGKQQKLLLNKIMIVIDGWYFHPSWVAQMPLDSIWSGWIVASEAVLEEPERKDVEC
jgi:hypothetical protein